MLIRDLTITMAIAAYSHSEPDKQVVRMAKRYRRKCISSKDKRTLRRIIESSKPAYLVTITHEVISK